MVNKFVEWKESYSLEYISSVVLTSDCKYIISGCWGRSIKMFDFETKEEIHHFYNAHEGK